MEDMCACKKEREPRPTPRRDRSTAPPRLFRRCSVRHTRTCRCTRRRRPPLGGASLSPRMAMSRCVRTQPLGAHRLGREEGVAKACSQSMARGPRQNHTQQRKGRGVACTHCWERPSWHEKKADTSRSAAAVGAVGAVGAAVTGSFHGLRWFRAHQTNATPKRTPKHGRIRGRSVKLEQLEVGNLEKVGCI